MDDRIPSPASSSSSVAVRKHSGRLRRHAVEEDGGDRAVSCTGKSCQSCTAEVIADCVAVCCCPCAVVNFFALAFFKLPWAVARRCISGGRKKRRGMLEEKSKYCCAGGDTDGISEKGRVEDGTLEIVLSSSSTGGGIGTEGEVNDDFSAEFSAEEVWLELYEVGHLGFGRVSFTGPPFHNKGN